MNGLALLLAVITALTSCAYSNNVQVDFPYNLARLIVSIKNSPKITVVSIQYADCVKCLPIDLMQITQNFNTSLPINVYYPNFYFYFFDRSSGKFYCDQFAQESVYMGENGTYWLEINYDNATAKHSCLFHTVKEPVPLYWPIVISFGSLIGIGLLYALIKYLYVRYFVERDSRSVTTVIVNSDFGSPDTTTTSELNASRQNLIDNPIGRSQPKATKLSGRMKSVDVFRGLCLAIMMFANFGAGSYSFLNHSAWNGLNLADLVFPCFIFIMGISIPLSFKSMARKSTESSPLRLTTILYRMLKRTILLFGFGLYVSNSYDSLTNGQLRIMGVLQRFAISYLICALIELFYFRMNEYTYPEGSQDVIDSETWSQTPSTWLRFKNMFKEVFLYPIQWLIASLLAVLWLLLTFLLPVDGCPTGYLGPGGLHENASHYNCTGGSAAYIDRLILGPNHMYSSPTCQFLYLTKVPYDPEGLLGCLTSCVLAYFGVATGHIIMHYKKSTHRIYKFFLMSIVFGLIAGVLCKFSRDDGWIPINKNLWSLSFILAIGSIALLCLIALYAVIDLADYYSGTPFLYLGRNSIAIYLCSELFTGQMPNINEPSLHPIAMAYSLYWIALWTFVAYLMDSKKAYFSL